MEIVSAGNFGPRRLRGKVRPSENGIGVNRELAAAGITPPGHEAGWSRARHSAPGGISFWSVRVNLWSPVGLSCLNSGKPSSTTTEQLSEIPIPVLWKQRNERPPLSVSLGKLPPQLIFL